jgi:hypothetical protein
MYLMNNIPNICTPQNTRWTCPNANIFLVHRLFGGQLVNEF